MMEYLMNPDLQMLRSNLLQFFDRVKFGRYLCDYKLDQDQSARYEFERFATYAKESTILIAIDHTQQIRGVAGFHISKWDTDLFFKKIAIIRYFLVEEQSLYQHSDVAEGLLDRFHRWVSESEVEMAIVRLDASIQTPVLLVQERGYRFYECANYLTLDAIPSEMPVDQGFVSRWATKDDLSAIEALAARQFFHRSHFFLDPGIPEDKAEAVYSKWVRSAMSGQEKVLIAEQNGEILGIFLYQILDLRSYLGKIFAVWKMAVLDEKARGHGAGWKLFNCAIRSCHDAGSDSIDSSYVVHNISSYNIHARLGFRLIFATYTFHKWFK
jgi:L-amino acid N-acyltransferase YncA